MSVFGWSELVLIVDENFKPSQDVAGSGWMAYVFGQEVCNSWVSKPCFESVKKSLSSSST